MTKRGAGLKRRTIQKEEVVGDFVIGSAEWVEGPGSHDGQWLRCPACGEPWGHVARVATEIDPSGDENGTGLYPGTTETVEYRSQYRRPAVRIDIQGECGHNWTLLIQQHKGALIPLARYPSPDHPIPEVGNELPTPGEVGRR